MFVRARHSTSHVSLNHQSCISCIQNTLTKPPVNFWWLVAFLFEFVILILVSGILIFSATNIIIFFYYWLGVLTENQELKCVSTIKTQQNKFNREKVRKNKMKLGKQACQYLCRCSFGSGTLPVMYSLTTSRAFHASWLWKHAFREHSVIILYKGNRVPTCYSPRTHYFH